MYGLIGMGAAFAGSTRAGITAVLILFELTGEYTIILPLMLAIVAATVVSRALSKDTIYTLKLTRRGVDLDAAHSPHGRLARRTVGTVMEPMPQPLPASTPIEAAGGAVWLSANGVVPVMGADERFHGCGTARTIAEALDNTEARDGMVGDLAAMPARITERSTLGDALSALGSADGTGLPVLDADGRVVVGWLTHRAVLAALSPAPVAGG